MFHLWQCSVTDIPLGHSSIIISGMVCNTWLAYTFNFEDIVASENSDANILNVIGVIL